MLSNFRMWKNIRDIFIQAPKDKVPYISNAQEFIPLWMICVPII